MKKRVLWKMFLLEIVTFGIYRLYFLVKTRNEMMERNKDIKIKSVPFLVVPMVIAITTVLIATIVIFVTVPKNLDCVQTSSSQSTSSLEFSDGSFVQPETTSNSSSVSCHTKPGSSSSVGLVTLLVFLLIFASYLTAIVMYIIWIVSYCHGVVAITNGEIDFTAIVLIMILVPDGFDILIAQHYFNHVGETAPPAAPAAPTAPAPAA